MKVYLKLTYKGENYFSKKEEMTQDEFEDLEKIVTSTLSGDAGSFQFDGEKETYYFSSNVLKESIITITKK